jgi:glutamyl-tRNA reductase
MNIIVLGISHKTTPVEIREKYSIKEEDLPAALKELKDVEDVLECVILSTCNRVEIYALTVNDNTEDIKDFLFRRGAPSMPIRDQRQRWVYTFEKEQALEHLCRVSSGLDSMVLGEPQIFGQMKDAYNLALNSGTVGSVFRSLFPQIFSAVKEVRSLTDIGESNVSVSSVAVSLARRVFGDIQGKTVMILGTGEMGELTVRNLLKQGVKRVYVTNRTFEKAVTLAKTFDGIPVMLYEFPEYLPSVDILISTISAEGYVVQRTQVAKAHSLRDRRPFLVIDISVPRSVNPDVSALENLHLYNIDDLKSVAEANLSIRAKEAQKADQMIKDRVRTMLSKLSTDDIVPAIISLRDSAEEIRRQKYEELINSLNVSEDQKNQIESFSKSIVKRIVHQTIVKMREYANTMRYK